MKRMNWLAIEFLTARSGIARYIDYNNSRLPHSSLDAMTPDAFYFKHLPLMQRAA